MTEQSMQRLMRAFLADHPEHIPGYRLSTPEEQAVLREKAPSGLMDTECLLAFVEWTIAKGYGDREKCLLMRDQVRRQLGQ